MGSRRRRLLLLGRSSSRCHALGWGRLLLLRRLLLLLGWLLLLLRLLLWRPWQGNHGATNPFQKHGPQWSPRRHGQVGSLAFDSVLQELDQADCDRKFGSIQSVGRRIVCHGPNVFQLLHGQLGSREKCDGFSSTNRAGSIGVGGLEQAIEISLYPQKAVTLVGVTAN